MSANINSRGPGGLPGTAGLFLAAVLLPLILGSCNQTEPLSLGAILPMTGEGSIPDVERGMRLALEELNESGGINGREISLHLRDSAGNPGSGAEQLRGLEEDRAPLLVFSALSSVTQAVSSEAERSQIPLIGLVATDPSIPEGKEWTYVFYPSARHEVEPIFSILRRQELRSVAVWHFGDAYGASVAREMRGRAEGTVIEVEGREYQGEGSRRTAELLSGHDAVYMVGFASHIVDMRAALAETGFDGAILSTSTATIPSLRRERDLDGLFVAAPLMYNDSFVFAREVSNRYRERYDLELSHYAATGYDIVKIVAGLLDGEPLQRGRVTEILEEGFIYPGVFGEIILRSGSNNIYFPLYPAQIDGETLRYIQ